MIELCRVSTYVCWLDVIVYSNIDFDHGIFFPPLHA